MKNNTLTPVQTATTQPKYYEVDGALKGNGRVGWIRLRPQVGRSNGNWA